MTRRKTRSPREILSRFDDAARQKRREGQSSVEDFSIFDVVETQKDDDAQSPGTAAAKQLPDRAKTKQPTANKQTPQARKHLHWRPSWDVAEAARAKELEIDNQPASYQSSPSTGEARTKVRTAGQKVKIMLVPVLSIVVVLLVIEGFFPDIWGLLEETIVAGGSLRVKGILHDQDKASAIVNNQVVYEGDKISGATVIRIDRDSVEFEVTERWPREGQRRVTKKVHR
jgi:hypothetical protein